MEGHLLFWPSQHPFVFLWVILFGFAVGYVVQIGLALLSGSSVNT